MGRTLLLKYILLFLPPAVLTSCCRGQQIPSAKEVITTFFTRYSFEDNDKYPKFWKKKEGWYIVDDSYSDPEHYGNPQLFWSHKENDYLPVHYQPAVKDTNVVNGNISNYLRTIDWNYEEYQFNRLKYYGYPGWDWDLINEPAGKNQMDDTAWEGLARAYSKYASGFIFDQAGNLFLNKDPDRVVLPDSIRINNSRIAKFILYQTKAIGAYKNLIKINPEYQTRVGNARLKLAGEYLFAWFDLFLAGDEKNARIFLGQAEYPDSVLDICRAYLNQTPQDGILISSGDNITYPLWYLQEEKNMRRDVLVLNKELLGLRRYIGMLDKKYKGRLFTTKDSVYYKNNFDYFLYQEGKEFVHPEEAGNFIYDLDNYDYKKDTNRIIYKGEQVKKYRAKELYFDKTQSKDSIVNSVIKTITLKNDFLMIDDFLLLDIINTNMAIRKICFTYSDPLFENVLEKGENIYTIKFDE